MVQASFPLNNPGATGIKILSEDKWTRFFRYVVPTGIFTVTFTDDLNELAVTAPVSGRTVKIDSGAAAIQGIYYDNNDPALSVTLDPETVLTYRIDLICLRLKWGPSGGVYAYTYKGTVESTCPAPKQEYGVYWDLPLAEVKVPKSYISVTAAMITDRRHYIGPGNAKTTSVIVAASDAGPTMRANADFVVPAGSITAQTTINNAFAALPATGGTVTLSEGNYNISNSIATTANSSLAGQGEGTVITCNAAMATAPAIRAAHACTIKHLKLIGNAPTTIDPEVGAAVGDGFDGILITSSSVRVEDLHINYFKDTAIMMDQAGGYISSVVIKDCTIASCYGSGVTYSGGYGYLINNRITGMGLNGIVLIAWANQLTNVNQIMDNILDGCGRQGIQITSSGTAASTRFNTIGGNQIAQCGQYGTGPAYTGILLEASGGGSNNGNSLMGNVVWCIGTTHCLEFGIGISAGVTSARVVGNNGMDSTPGRPTDNFVDDGSDTQGGALNLGSWHA
jgi:Right handed beta helix region